MTLREVYPNAPLAAVIVEIRHPTAPALSTAEVAALRESLASDVPIVRTEQLLELQASVGSLAPVAMTRLLSRDRHQSVSLRPNGIVIESTDYGGWAVFRELVNAAVVARQEIAPVDGVERVGLRYIDEIRPPMLDNIHWGDWVSTDLLGGESLGTRIGRVATAQQGIAQFGSQPDPTHTLRWGTSTGQAFISGENLRRLTEPSGPFFLIDTDGGWTPPDGSVPELIPDQIMTTLESLHGPTGEIFEATITERLRDEVLRVHT